MKKLVLLFLLLFSIAVFSFAQQNISAPQKFALVIGNGNYTGISRLSNPVNDANDMETALRGLGFTVEKVLNGSLEQMESAVINLRRRLSGSRNSYGFFFYAGHGVQSNGENYLIPVAADNIRTETQLRDRAVSLQFVLDTMNEAGNELNMVVLDACRDNPFGWARSGSRGLSVVSRAPSGTIVMYATGANSTASDGTGRNGLFTGHLLSNLKTQDLSVFEVFDKTMEDVINTTGGTQHPELSLRFPGATRAYLGTRTAAPVTTTVPPAPVATPPPVPANVLAGTPGTNTVTISWNNAGSGISYRLYFSTQNDLSSANVFGNPVTGTSINISNLTAGTNYFFWVSSLLNNLESAKSSVVSVRTATPTPTPTATPAPTITVQPTPAATAQTVTVQPAPVVTAAQPVPAAATIPANMVRINGGTFTMGSPANEARRQNIEGPQRQVTVSSFYMGKYEVTQKEYQEVMGVNPSSYKGDNLPVERVTWFDAIEYCNKLSQREGLTPVYTITGRTPASGYPITAATVTVNWNNNGYRLPTEAEWEYACRAGTTTAYNTGATINNNTGWYRANSNNRTQPVGQKPANAWGLHDMHGNVLEWCWDVYGEYTSGAQTNPRGAASGSYRVIRGGSWNSFERNLRSAFRNGINPGNGIGTFGFRVVRP